GTTCHATHLPIFPHPANLLNRLVICRGFGRNAAMDNLTPRAGLDSAEMGVIAHLYRGEIYRSTLWRTRLDTTTNWSVVTLGVALSIAYSSPQASPLPLVLVGILIVFFLMLEARRYRYFNVW